MIGGGKNIFSKTIWNTRRKNMFDFKIFKFIQQVFSWKTLVS